MVNSIPPGERRPLAASSSSLSRSARYGLILFFIYCLFYGGFVAMNAFAAARMAEPMAWLGGINLAVAYGMALIVLAFLLAMLYMALCKPIEDGQEGVLP